MNNTGEEKSISYEAENADKIVSELLAVRFPSETSVQNFAPDFWTCPPAIGS